MKFEDFKQLITLIQNASKYIDTLYDLNVDITNSVLLDSYYKITDKYLNTIVKNGEALDLIYWYLYENVDKVITVKDKSIDVSDIKDFYNFLATNNYLV